MICFELEQHSMQNANRSDCERANKQTGTQKEQQWKLEKENSNETSITPPRPLSPTVFQQYSDIRHRCSCHMTVAHPRDLLRCIGRKTPDFKRIPQGWIYNDKIIYWMASMDKQKFVEFCVWCHSPHMLLSFQLYRTFSFRGQAIMSDYCDWSIFIIFLIQTVLSFSLVLSIYLFLIPEAAGKRHNTSRWSRTPGGMC